MAKKKRWGNRWKDSRNWREYNRELVERGVFYIAPRFLATWKEEIEVMNRNKRGGQYIYPQSMIEFLAVLYSKGFDYRSLQGILEALSEIIGPFPVISFSQIRRRMLTLPVSFRRRAEKMVVGGDGTGLKVSNRGTWIREKWKVMRGWIKVVILGDVHGNVVDLRVGDENLDERAASREMMLENRNRISRVLLDGFHDCEETFELCDAFGIETGIKIRANANPKGLGRRAKEVRLYQNLGYRDWAKEKGYGMRWVATEGIFSAVKRMFGECVRAHKESSMYHEAMLKFWAYQQLRDLG